ncbi:MAG: DUF945 domain-containing protein [Ruminococcaceae bacterium]|nr:DUF945 domain-containing protein [Oscillospiraceae bacterium]
MKKVITVFILIVAVLAMVLAILYYVGSGFAKRYDVYISDYSVSEDGTQLKFSTGIFSSMGHTRGFKDSGGGVKPHYLSFYATFGGLNSTFGAKTEFVLPLGKNDTEIYVADIGGGYKLALKKNEETGIWERP